MTTKPHTKREANRFKQLFEESVLSMVLLEDGLFTEANPASAELLRVAGPEKMIGLSPLDFSPPLQPCGRPSKELVYEAIQTTFEKGSYQFDWEAMRADGTHLFLSIVLTVIGDKERPIIHAVFQDISAEKAQRDELAFRAYHDLTTGLSNREKCIEDLEILLAQGELICLINIGVDDFKYFNNTYGYEYGDSILRAVVDLIEPTLRDGDTLYRGPGGTFILSMGFVPSKRQVEFACEKISDLFTQSLQLEHFKGQLQVSIGAAISDPNTSTASDLIRQAQTALVEAANDSKDNYLVFDGEMRRRQETFFSIRSDLKQALQNNEFELFYQPQRSLLDHSIVGAEALIRWRHPTRGLVPPNDFIEIAEQTGLIIPITKWVIEEAAQQTKAWTKEPWGEKFVVSVNLPADFFAQTDAKEEIDKVLERSDLAPIHFGVELTESVLLQHPEELIELIKDWRKSGITISIDDFGTGYSSLSYLAELDFHKLKIDQSFVRGYSSNVKTQAILRSTILMSRSLGLETVAEGVEDQQMANILKVLGVNVIQGYLLSKPLPADEFKRWMETSSKIRV